MVSSNNDSGLLMRLAESSARVEEAISGIRRDIESLRRDFGDEKSSAHGSRREVQEKFDELTDRTVDLEGTVKIVGATAAQTRDIVEQKVMPVVAEFTAIKWQGAGMLGAATLAGGFLAWVISTFGAAILARLGFHF